MNTCKIPAPVDDGDGDHRWISIVRYKYQQILLYKQKNFSTTAFFRRLEKRMLMLFL